jgi:isopenicillin N synthase-like dioxygenase
MHKAADKQFAAAGWREQFDLGAERPAVEHAEGQPAWKRLQGSNLWPEALPELKLTLLQAFVEALALPTTALMRCTAANRMSTSS